MVLGLAKGNCADRASKVVAVSKQHPIWNSDTAVVLLAAVGCGSLSFAITKFGLQEGNVSAVRLSSAWLLGILILRQPSFMHTCVLLLAGWVALSAGLLFTGNFSPEMSLGLGGAGA